MISRPENHLKKWLIKIVIVLLIGVLLVVGYQRITQYGAKLSGKLLKQLVTEHSEGDYGLIYNSIDISIFNKEITVKDFVFDPQPELDSLSENALFRISIPNVSIQLGSLIKLYKEKELTLRTIRLDDPLIEMVRINKQEKRTFSLEAGDLYKLLGGYLNKFAIDSLSLISGKFNYADQAGKSDRQLSLNDLEFKIKNLVIDSDKMEASRFLFAENLVINLSEQTFLLGDSIHMVHFDKFSFSTKSRNILFENLSLTQRKNIKKDTAGLNTYDVHIPNLNFRGINFYKAYSENILDMDSMRLADARIRLNITSGKKIPDTTDNSLTTLLSKIYDEVKIGSIYLDNSSFSINHSSSNQSSQYSLNNANASISDLNIDFDRFSLEKRIRYLNSFQIKGEKFYFRTDSNHLVQIHELNISSADSLLLFNNFKIKFPGKKFNLNASSPDLRLSGLDFIQLWMNKNLVLRQAFIEQPIIDLEVTPFAFQDEQEMEPGMIHNLFINDIGLENLKMKIRYSENDLSIEQMSFHGEKIRMMENQGKTSLDSIIKDFSVIGQSIMYRNPKAEINIETLDLPNHFHRIKARNIQLATIENDSLLELGDLYLSGLLPLKLYQDQKLVFDTLSIANMDLYVGSNPNDNKDQKVPELLKNPTFKTVSFQHTNLHLFDPQGTKNYFHDIDGRVHSFSFNEDSSRITSAMDLNIDSINYHLAKIGHQLTAKGFEIKNSDSSLHITQSRLTPIDTLAPANKYQISTASVRLSKINFDKLLNDGQMIFQNGYVADPDLMILLDKSNKGQTVNQILKFNSLNISHGKINYIVQQPELHIESDTFNLLINNFDLSNDSLFVHAVNYLLDAKHIHFKSESLHDTISVNYIIASTKRGDFEIQDLVFEQEDMMKVQVPRVHLRGLKTRDLINHNRIEWDTITFEQPMIDLGLEKKNDSYISKQTSQQKRLPSIKAGFIDLQDGNINIHHPEANHGDSIKFHSLQLAINNMHLEEGREMNFSDPFFESFDLSGEDLTYTLPDSLYKVQVHEYSYDHIRKRLKLTGFVFLPLYDRREFQNHIQYQEDWLNGRISYVELDEFHMDSILFHETLNMRKLTIDEFHLDTHRDKRIPRKEGIIKPLPVTALKELPINVKIDTILVNHAFVSHSEYAPDGDLPGNLYFQRIDGSLINVTNDPSLITQNPIMTFDASGVLMNTGNFSISTAFNLANPNDIYEMSGRIGPMELKELNTFLEHTASVIIRDGKNEALTFSFTADNRYAVGEMRFFYDDLKISILKENSDPQKNNSASIKSFFANTFIVNTRNPHFIFLREGDIFHIRNKEKSIFNYWGKALISGAVSSIGAKNNKKEIRQLNKEIKKELDTTEN